MNFGIALFPFSWHLGLWSRPKKSIFAFGPLRFINYKSPGAWKPDDKPFNLPFDLRPGINGDPPAVHYDTCQYPKKGCTCRAWETSPLG